MGAGMSNLDAALALAKRGFAVFPCWENAKEPLTPNGFKDASKDPAVILGWWRRYLNANVGVACGAVSGKFVVDVDVKGDRDGEADLRLLEKEHGALPATVESITPSRGRHLWFNMPEDRRVPSKVGWPADGLDIRGDGGYVVVPPSYVIEKKKGYEGPYVWSVDCAPAFADAPAWLLDLVCEGKKERKPPGYFKELSEGVSDGSRNESLAQIIGALIRAGMTGRQAYDYGIYWNERNTPPLDEKRIGQCVLNIQKREKKRLAKWKK
jgi:putative DNA primase/helicase